MQYSDPQSFPNHIPRATEHVSGGIENAENAINSSDKALTSSHCRMSILYSTMGTPCLKHTTAYTLNTLSLIQYLTSELVNAGILRMIQVVYSLCMLWIAEFVSSTIK